MVQLYRRKGDDRLVNTQTVSSQRDAQIAVLPDGGYVVVWTDNGIATGDGDDSSIKAQRFDASGEKVGGEFIVNTATHDNQTFPFVATLTSGRFAVTWTDESRVGGDS